MGVFLAFSSAVLMIQLGEDSDIGLADFINTFLCFGILTTINQNSYVRAVKLGRPGKV